MATYRLRVRVLSIALAVPFLVPGGALAGNPEPSGGSTGGLLPPGETGQTDNLPSAGDAAAMNTVRANRAIQVDAARSAAIANAMASSGNEIVAAAACPDPQEFCSTTHTVLKTNVTGLIVEPRAKSRDDNHDIYEDYNYWNFCTAGAVTVATYYWRPSYVTGRSGQNYTEPYGPKKVTTYWESSDTGGSADTGDGYPTKGRGHLMYIAEKVKPPAFTRAGIDDFDTYPTTGASMGDAKIALNWEISGRDPDIYLNYFYGKHNPANYTQTQFVNAVKSDLFDYAAAVVVGLDTYLSSSTRLPNWNRSLFHAITIIGYDDSNSTFIYIDTCGKQCNSYSGNHNGGTYSVSYATMYKLAKEYGASLW